MKPVSVYGPKEVRTLVRTLTKGKRMGLVKTTFEFRFGKVVIAAGLHELATLRWLYEMEMGR